MLIEILRQSLYTRDIQPTSNPLQICGHLRSCYACSGCLLIVYFQIKRKSPVNDAFMGLFFYTCKTNYKEVDVQKMRINGCAFVQFFVFFLKTRNIVP